MACDDGGASVVGIAVRALLTPAGTMHCVFRTLSSPASPHRAQADELLRQVVSPESLRVGSLKLLDEGAPWEGEAAALASSAEGDAAAWLEGSGDPWIRLALRHDSARWIDDCSGPLDGGPREATLDRILFLKDVALFLGLTNRQLVEVARVAEEVERRAGEILFREGEPSDYLHLVRRGKLRVLVGDHDVAHLGLGEWDPSRDAWTLVEGLPGHKPEGRALRDGSLVILCDDDVSKDPDTAENLLRRFVAHVLVVPFPAR